MKLVAGSAVISRMNLQGVFSGSTNGIESAIEGATSQLVNVLGTELAAHTRVDYFSVQSRDVRRATSSVTLRLAQQFVNDKVAPVVKYKPATSNDPFVDSASMTVMEAARYTIDYVKGLVTVYPSIPVGVNCLAVEYQAGFKDLDPRIPEALKDGAISFAIAINYQESVTVGKRETARNASGLFITARNTISGLIIPNGLGIEPSISRVIK